MQLQNQVTSLELSKRLKELNVKQDSLFYWTRLSDTPDGRQDWVLKDFKFSEPIYDCSAFTVAELGELLPEKVAFYKYQKRSGNAWRINFGDMEFGGQTEAESKAKMLIYLIENKLITL